MNSSHSHKLLYKIPRDSLVPLWVMNEASLSFFNPSLLSGSIGRLSKGGGHIYMGIGEGSTFLGTFLILNHLNPKHLNTTLLKYDIK